MQVEKSAMVGNIDLQAAAMKKLKARKESLAKGISKKDGGIGSDRKRFKRANIYGCLDLRHSGVASKVLITFSARCGCETTDLCQSDATKRR